MWNSPTQMSFMTRQNSECSVCMWPRTVTASSTQMSLQGVTGSWWAEAKAPGSSLSLQGYEQQQKQRQVQPQRQDEETPVPFALLSVPLPSAPSYPTPTALGASPAASGTVGLLVLFSPPAFARRTLTDTSSGMPRARFPGFWKPVWGSHELLLGSPLFCVLSECLVVTWLWTMTASGTHMSSEEFVLGYQELGDRAPASSGLWPRILTLASNHTSRLDESLPL